MAGSWLTDSVIANPMSIYPEYWERRSSWFRTMSAGVIEIILEDGTSGCGFMGGGKASAAVSVLDEQMRDLIVGKSVFETELIQEQLYRASIFYGRGGFTQSIISAIDIALWDAKGKLLGQPVYNLLGGGCRTELPVYYTGYDPEALEAFGIRDMKIAVPYGPVHGEDGMAKNEAAVARAREVLGDEAFIALDIYMGWDVPYTIRMYERLHKYRIAWLEEPVMPDDYDGYRTIRRSVGTMVTGGEHEYTLAGFRRLIEDGCVDIVQPDIYRAGGPTALKKIAALAKAHNVKMVCHGVGSPTYHFLSTNGPELTPFAEYVDIYRGATTDWVLTDDPRPHNGRITLTDAPGFGYDLNRTVFRDSGAVVTTIW
jgi:L-alanine-DL-glutamate epimerase-like enolase superfamily enzyme